MGVSTASFSIETAQLLDKLCALLHDPDCEERSGLSRSDVEDQTARFRVWAGNLGAFQRLPAASSLDHRLRESPKILNQVIQSLQDIQNAVASIIAISSGERPNRRSNDAEDDNDDDDDDYEFHQDDNEEATIDDESYTIPQISDCEKAQSTESVETSEASELFGSIKDTIASLFRLAMIIRRSSPRDRFAKALSGANPFDESYDIAHVGQKYPKLWRDVNRWLCDRLGRAASQRRQFLRYSREHRIKLDKGAVREETQKSTATDTKPLEPSRIVFTKSQAGRTDATKPLSTLVPTSASTFLLEEIPTHVDFSDVQSQTSFALSVGHEDDSEQYQLPRLSEVSQGAASFECPLCWTIQSFRKESAWRKHVHSDLRPYLCTFDTCDLKLFSDRHEWFEHELQYHRTEWTCQFCEKDKFKTAESFRKHLIQRHVEGFTESQISALLETGGRPVTSISATECPFCDDWASSLRDANPELPGDTLVVTLAQFRHHVGAHFQKLAVFSIPRGHLENGQGDVDSAASVQAAGLGSHDSSQRSVTSSRSLPSDDSEYTRPPAHSSIKILNLVRHIERTVIYSTGSSIIATLMGVLPVLTSSELQELENHITIPKIICTSSEPLKQLIESTCRGKSRCEAFWLALWPSIPPFSNLWQSIALFTLVGRRRTVYPLINESLMEYTLSISGCVDDACRVSMFPEWICRSLKKLAADDGRCEISPIENFHSPNQVKIFEEWITSESRSDEDRSELLSWCMGHGGRCLEKFSTLYREMYPHTSVQSRLRDFFAAAKTTHVEFGSGTEHRASRDLFLEAIIMKVTDPRGFESTQLHDSLNGDEGAKLLSFYVSRLHWRDPGNRIGVEDLEAIPGFISEHGSGVPLDHDYKEYCRALILSNFDLQDLEQWYVDNNHVGDKVRDEICAIPGVLACANLGLERRSEDKLDAKPIFEFDPDAYVHNPQNYKKVEEAIRHILGKYKLLGRAALVDYIPIDDPTDENSTLQTPSDQSKHWAQDIFDGRYVSHRFYTPSESTGCWGRDEPRVLRLLEEDGFEQLLELMLQSPPSELWVVGLYWRPDDGRARCLLLHSDSEGNSSRFCYPLTALEVRRRESALKLCRIDREDGSRDVWANLQFGVYEEMVLFCNTVLSLRDQDATGVVLGFEDFLITGEVLEFSGEIVDGQFLQAFRVFRDKYSGGARFEVTARRGHGKGVPIWTAFVAEFVGLRNWIELADTYTVRFQELRPYVFRDGYAVPKDPYGKHTLCFTCPDDARMLVDTFHKLGLREELSTYELHDPQTGKPRYQSVQVLMIRWADDFKGLAEKQEDMDRLTSIFRDVFHYSVTTCTLQASENNSEKTLDAVLRLIGEHDSPNTLFIACYAGLGEYGVRAQSLSMVPESGSNPEFRLQWDIIDKTFLSDDMEGDVLYMLDCRFIDEELILPQILDRVDLSIDKKRTEGRAFEVMLARPEVIDSVHREPSLLRCLYDHLRATSPELPIEFYSSVAMEDAMEAASPHHYTTISWIRFSSKEEIQLYPLDARITYQVAEKSQSSANQTESADSSDEEFYEYL